MRNIETSDFNSKDKKGESKKKDKVSDIYRTVVNAQQKGQGGNWLSIQLAIAGYIYIKNKMGW